MDVTGLADPYVKVYLLYKGQRVAKKKTHVKKRTLNPVYNESFVFEVPADNLDSVSLELLLLDWDRVTKNEVNGTELMLTPEHSIQIQNTIGADIMMQLDDVCPSTMTGK
ncbi:synaptotagmin-11-like [Diaphorina citri]|uniref:Synaptotagmin-11-like n=1 Tax=Diaphorina citri TaxID=121845 RepID=A0A3Q0IPQ8_DIACI|nr:synaptotagmin-11-like [Diaphorina citri]